MVRTVSMLPAATEIVGCLGLMDDLIAVSHECDYPEQANHRTSGPDVKSKGPIVEDCGVFEEILVLAREF
jgi:hypothetical protein